ncbi:betamannosidase [Acanthamoeba castellanii str. Neff]|uniref:Beta-mannosidase B n=1 Tax=Acanthamoeba castellanii (strain ATCC 30010 / Neff) TaxID=1257118 RepID=L8GX06_ACACF|nr:betamannosidase [Acanthamoeba castellanii str. Neff]ELR17078.1 betamannosidase [Acanthamoeba castellanii str. Neff]
MEIEGGTMDLAGEWTLRYQPQQLAGEKREQHLKQQYLNRHPAPSPDLLAKLQEGVKISVPCDVHTGLMQAGLLGDLYAGRGEEDYRWMVHGRWIFARTFVIPPDYLKTHSRVKVNGREVGTTENMFRQYVFTLHQRSTHSGSNSQTTAAVPVSSMSGSGSAVPVVTSGMGSSSSVQTRAKPILVEGDNEIEIEFSSAVDYCQEQASTSPYPMEYTYGEKNRGWIRKRGCDFGWDWGPCFVPCGIQRPIRLVAFSEFSEISTLTCHQVHNLKKHFVTLHLSLLLTAVNKMNAVFSLELKLKDEFASLSSVPIKSALEAGENRVKFQMEVSKPALWWPRGYGDQPLYELSLTVRGESEERRLCVDLGLRQARLVTKPDDVGESFYLEINGTPVFAKGANWIPPDCFDGRVLDERLKGLLESAAAANMNCIRVWGGGMYERHYFYELCDKLGLMVLHDFMFACSLYPTTKAFLQNVEKEVQYQLRRLSRHCSIVLWYGNNENEEALDFWEESRSNRDLYVCDYFKLYYDTVHATYALEDPHGTIPFWPSSPSNGMHKWGKAGDHSKGDSHYWAVWHSNKPFSEYLKVCPRFCSEFGFQSFPSVPTLRQVIADPDEDFNTERDPVQVTSAAMEFRQRSPAMGNKAILEHICRQFKMPNSFENFVYVSQVLQALSIKTASEHWRRCKPTCMGVVYWQLNDIWQGPSWSSIEYDGRWKVLQYYARHFFAPLLVSSLETTDGEVEVWVTSDLASTLALTLTVQLWTWHGKQIGQWHESLKAEPHCSKAVWKRKVKDLLKTNSLYEEEKERAKSFLLLSLSSSESGTSETAAATEERSLKWQSQNVHFLSAFKHVGLLPARLSLRPEQPKPVVAKTLRQVSKGKEAGSVNELEEEIASSAAEADVNDLSKVPVDAEKKEDEQQGDGENESGDAEDDEGSGHRQQDAIRLEVVNESDEAVVPFVFLESAAMKGRFSDNGFLLLPRSTRRVRFYPQAPQPGALVRKRSGNSSSSNESALAKERLEEEQRKRAAAFLAQCSVTSLRDAYASRSSRDLCGPQHVAKEQ